MWFTLIEINANIPRLKPKRMPSNGYGVNQSQPHAVIAAKVAIAVAVEAALAIAKYDIPWVRIH
jgi:hypothetical protein